MTDEGVDLSGLYGQGVGHKDAGEIRIQKETVRKKKYWRIPVGMVLS